MKAKLFVASAAARGQEFVIGNEASIGRSRGSAIRLEPEGVSSRHARIYFDGDRKRYYLEDLGSLNGTTLDGLPVTRAELFDRVLIAFGIAIQLLEDELTDPGEADDVQMVERLRPGYRKAVEGRCGQGDSA